MALGETPRMQDNKKREAGLPLDQDHQEATMFFGERLVQFSTALGGGLSVVKACQEASIAESTEHC